MQKRLKMALERQKAAAEKKSTHQQHQQKQAEGLMPRMKVSKNVVLSQSPVANLIFAEVYLSRARAATC